MKAPRHIAAPLLLLLLGAGPAPSLPAPTPAAEVDLTPCADVRPDGALCGTLEVPEDAERPDGRRIALEIVVLRATGDSPRPDPVFYLPGGPGAPATPAARGFAEHPSRVRHDFVFVDARGTAGDDALGCEPESGGEVRDRLEIFARTHIYEACRDRLAASADLGEYSTPRMVDDFEAARLALGYGPVNLIGVSGGTRSALVYMRRYPDSVRSAVLNGVVPTAFRNPLHHARSAQDALDGLIDLCEGRPECAAAYPAMRTDLDALVERLRTRPETVTVAHPETGEPITIDFDASLLGESLRQLMYSSARGARVPLLLHRAAAGDLGPLADLAVSRAVGGSIAIGLLNSIVCSEDAYRITEAEVAAETERTLLGDRRVRQQLAVCGVWPRAQIEAAYGDPIATTHPVLLLSGTLDPVTPPRWGEEAARHLPESLHLVVPGGHGVGGRCIGGIVDRFLDAGSVREIDVACTRRVRYPDFELPGSADDGSSPGRAERPAPFGVQASAEAAVPPDRLRRAAESVLPAVWPMLRESLSIPNDAHFPEHVEANVQWMERAFEERGFDTGRLDTGGPPLLLAERQVAGAERTVLIYLQIDGQPVDPSAWSQHDPYRPVLKEREGEDWREIPWESLEHDFDPEWRVFARSASDAKGPAIAFLAALDALEDAGLEPDFDLRVIMDFEEELGSPHLPPAVDLYREALAADWLLIFDGPRHPSNRPTLTFGARGIATITLTVFGPRAPQHSGHYGNYAPNPAVRLAQLIASMKDAAGRVTIPGFYDGVEIGEAERALLARTPDDEQEIRQQIGIAAPDGVAATYQEAIQYPSLNVRGMSSGWIGEQSRTIVPAQATAEIDVRLVAESDPEHLIGLIRDQVAAQGYHLLDGREPTEQERMSHARLASFDSTISYRAFRTPFDSEVGLWLRSALGRAFEQEPVLIRTSGGSIPISPFVDQLGLPAVTVPTVNRDNNQHSPNENLRLGNFVEAIVTYLAILTEPID